MRAENTFQTAAVVALTCLLSSGVAAAQTQGEQNVSGATDILDEVVVTGIRHSIQTAQNLKREAPSVVEAITLEDLGKFTDSSITDALARLPGVSIATTPVIAYGGGSTATIRGLGATYGSMTVNGRDAIGTSYAFLGGGGRLFDLAAIPPDVLAAVTVYKTSTSERLEPGMAGQIDLQTLRPLDYADNAGPVFGSASVGVSRYDNADEEGRRLNGIIGGEFFDGMVGVYLSAANNVDYVRRLDYRTYNTQVDIGIRDSSGNVQQYRDVWAAWSTDSWDSRYKYERLATAAGIQIKPSQNLDINIDGLYNDYTIEQDAQSANFQNSGVFLLSPDSIAEPGAAVIGGRAVPGVSDGGLTYYDTSRISNITFPDFGNSLALSYDAPFEDDSDYKYVLAGANAVWTSDDERFKAGVDFAHSENEYFTKWLRPYPQNGLGGESIFDARSGIPQYTFINTPDTDVSDPDSYTFYGIAEHYNKLGENARNSYRLDLAFQFTDGLTGKTGVNYQKSRYRFISMAFDPLTFPENFPANLFVDGSVNLAGYPVSVPNVSLANFCAANPTFCNQSNRGVGSMAGGFPRQGSQAGGANRPFIPATPGDTFDFSTADSFELREDITALYAQLDFNGELFGNLRYSGNAGLRAVNIKEDGLAFQGVNILLGFASGGVLDSFVEPVEAKHSYWEYLPSFNLTLNPLDNLSIRLGASKTISLADPQQLTPLGTVNVVVPTASGVAQPSVANVFNTELKPTSADNYDITAEYYTSYGGAYIASIFHKDVSDLIQTAVTPNVMIPGQGDRPFTLTTVINGAKGRVDGFELGTNQPFTFLPSPWDGFGVQANYTYVDSETNVRGFETPFVGAAKHNVSVNAYFEKYGFSARVAYLHRTEAVDSFGGGLTIVQPQDKLDVSVSQEFLDRYEVILTASNLLEEDLVQESQQGGYLAYYIEGPRSYSLAFRAKF